MSRYRRTRFLVAAALATASATTAADFDAAFTGRTLRWDYLHVGTAGEEHVATQQVRLEGDWPGRRAHLLDDTGLGKYRFVLRDAVTSETLYSTGFSSIYGEWETTRPARDGGWGGLHESQRFPEPRAPVELVLEKRDAAGAFVEIHREALDPSSRFVNRAPLPATGEPWAVFEHGPPSEKVDLLVLGDGYTADELDEYRQDARRVIEALFAFSPFAEHRADFNAWAIDVAAERSGISRPRSGFWNDTPLGLTYNAFDSERYMLSFDNRRWRDLAALAPYDALILIANSDQYGGGGIFNLYSTAAARSAQLPYLIVHEFGHAFAGLGDEYYTSQVSYEDFIAPGTEPWEPNVTALLDPSALKWADLATPGIDLPTPWNQAIYDDTSLAFQRQRAELRAAGVSEARMDEYFAEVQRVTQPMLQGEKHFGAVGAFEGAGYQAKGLYRPEVDCIMFTRNPDRYCHVCSAAIERVIRLHLGR